MKENKEKGYSAYIFSTDKSSDYCIIDQESLYAKLRLYVNVASMILSIAIMIASPLTLVAVYDYACKNLSGSWLFFAWSLMFVSGIAACLILVFDGFTIVYNLHLYPSTSNGVGFHDIFIYFIFFAAFLCILPIFDVIALIFALMCLQPSQREKFPVPELFKFCKKFLCCSYCIGCTGRGQARQGSGADTQPLLEGGRVRNWLRESCCSECIVLLVGTFSFTLFMQLGSFHALYILLGAICTPVESLSITSFYTACFFCLIALVAIVLKTTNKADYYQEFKWINVCKCILPIVATILFIISLALFIGYFYNYIIMVKSYSNNGGFLAILGSILPSALVALGGFGGTRLLKCIDPHQVPPHINNPAALPQVGGVPAHINNPAALPQVGGVPAHTNDPAALAQVGGVLAHTNDPAALPQVGGVPAHTNDPAALAQVGGVPAHTKDPAALPQVGGVPAHTNDPAALHQAPPAQPQDNYTPVREVQSPPVVEIHSSSLHTET